MRFSIAKLLVVMLLLNVLVCLSFAAPAWIGFPILTLIALIIVPPIIIVGAVNTRGRRQAFFLGCMVAGLPHFLYSLYFGVIMASSLGDLSWADDDGAWWMQASHLGGYFLGFIGGLSGLGAWYMIVGNEPKKIASKKQTTQTDFDDVDLPDGSFGSFEPEKAKGEVARTPK